MREDFFHLGRQKHRGPEMSHLCSVGILVVPAFVSSVNTALRIGAHPADCDHVHVT